MTHAGEKLQPAAKRGPKRLDQSGVRPSPLPPPDASISTVPAPPPDEAPRVQGAVVDEVVADLSQDPRSDPK